MTQRQLTYVLLRITYQNETITECATLSQYAKPYARTRGLEIEKYIHVRFILSTLLRNELEIDINNKNISDMSTEELIAWHTAIIQSGVATIREKQTSASELARLRGSYQRDGSGVTDSTNIMALLAKQKAQRASNRDKIVTKEGENQ